MAKKRDIKKIKKILSEWGSTSVGELQTESSPIVFSVGGVSVLAERFNVDNVGVTVYNNDEEIEADNMEYEDLSDDTISDILYILEDYDVDMFKTMQRIEN
jgi:hypothetical protein